VTALLFIFIISSVLTVGIGPGTFEILLFVVTDIKITKLKKNLLVY